LFFKKEGDELESISASLWVYCCGNFEGCELVLCYTLILSSNLMLYTMNENEPMIAAIEAKSIIPNIFSPFDSIISYMHS